MIKESPCIYMSHAYHMIIHGFSTTYNMDTQYGMPNAKCIPK